jgi:hypothetical protein
MLSSTTRRPRAFLVYSHEGPEHLKWVEDLAERLRQDGIETVLDRSELEFGDHLTEFMERSVREADFVLIVCTPRYKERSEQRIGGVGYEGDIITSEVLTTRDHRKFIPLLQAGEWYEAAPTWLRGKLYVDLRGESYSEEQYGKLLRSLLGIRPKWSAVSPAVAPADSRAPISRKSTEPEVGIQPVPRNGQQPVPNHGAPDPRGGDFFPGGELPQEARMPLHAELHFDQR